MVDTAGSSTESPPPDSLPQLTIGRRELLTLVSAVMALMAMGIDLMLPAFDDIRDAYGFSEGSNEVGQVVTVYFLGLSLAQLVFGPFADRFGRKPVLVVSVVIFMVGALGSALAPTFALLLVSRFVWGVGGAGARVIAMAIIRDRFEGDAMAKAMSQVMAVFVLVPVIAPAFGAGLIAVLPWRSVFWFCVFWGLAIGLWSRRLDETLRPEHVQALNLGQTWANYRRVATTPLTAGYTWAAVFLQAIMTLYLATIELIVGEIYDRDALFPLVFGIIAAGFGVGALINGRFVERFGMDRMVNGAFVVGLPLTVLFVLFSVVEDGRPPFWPLVVMMVPTLGMLIFLMPNLNTAAMLPVGDIAGAASAFIGGMRIALGSVIAIVLTPLITDSVTPFAMSILGLNVACALTVRVVRLRAGRRAAVEPAPVG